MCFNKLKEYYARMSGDPHLNFYSLGLSQMFSQGILIGQDVLNERPSFLYEISKKNI